MADPGWDEERPAEGVPEVPAGTTEIDITDATLAAAERAPQEADLAEADRPLEEAPVADPGPDEAYADGPDDPYATATDDRLAGVDDEDPALPPLRKVLESILLVVDEPVPEVNLAQVLEVPRADVLAALEALAEEYLRDGRGYELRNVAGGWRLYTAPDCAPYVERFVLDGQQARLTQAALETLAVIAYRQPVSRQAVAAIRGVNVDGVVRTLLSRGLIAEAGEEGPGGAHLYVTTPYFLERLGLRSLDELPNLAPLLPANIDDLADNA
jgi:segregation and condensation protein B